MGKWWNGSLRGGVRKTIPANVIKKSEILAGNNDSYLKIRTRDFRIMGYFLKLMSLS